MSQRERGRETGRICSGVGGGPAPCGAPRSLPTGIHHIGWSARGREKPGGWTAPAVSSCRALRGCREHTLRYVSTLTCTYAQSRSSVFKRCLHANAHSHTFKHNHMCSPQLILICVHAGSTPPHLSLTMCTGAAPAKE